MTSLAQTARLIAATTPAPFTQAGAYAEAFADLALSPILDALEADLAVLRARIDAACAGRRKNTNEGAN